MISIHGNLAKTRNAAAATAKNDQRKTAQW
jgi:hypothetical protein